MPSMEGTCDNLYISHRGIQHDIIWIRKSSARCHNTAIVISFIKKHVELIKKAGRPVVLYLNLLS